MERDYETEHDHAEPSQGQTTPCPLLLVYRKSYRLLGLPRFPKSKLKPLKIREVENTETKESSQARKVIIA